MTRAEAFAARQRALESCHAARGEFSAACSDAVRAYQAHKLIVLAGAVVLGVVAAKLRVGDGVIRGVSRIAGGPGWRVLKQWLGEQT